MRGITSVSLQRLYVSAVEIIQLLGRHLGSMEVLSQVGKLIRRFQKVLDPDGERVGDEGSEVNEGG